MNEIINKWRSLLNIESKITTRSINKEQVLIDDDVPEEDRYFVGVYKISNKKHEIIHDRPLRQDDIVHELLHVKFPLMSEKTINTLTPILLKI
jgi:hypothetical protein